MALCHAGPLIALIDTTKLAANARCKAALPNLSMPLTTTGPAFTEAMYLVYREGGRPLRRLLWQYVLSGRLHLHFADEGEQKRMAERMEQYSNVPMDLADASLVTAAEALNQSCTVTLDSDFYIYQRHDNQPFDVVP